MPQTDELDRARAGLADGIFPAPDEAGALCRALDWSATPLGPVERWPQSLRTAAQVTLASPVPHLLLWGDDLVQLPNSAWRARGGPQHPAAPGRPLRESPPQAWGVDAGCLQRALAGQPAVEEDARAPLAYTPVRDEEGAVAGVLVAALVAAAPGREAGGRARAEAALRESEARYRTLFDSIDEGFCIVQVLFDERERPVDYRFLEGNPAWERHTGLHGALGRTAREVLPGLEEHWFQTYGRVALTGEPVRFENGSAVMRRWFDVFAFRVGEPRERKVAILFTEISERKEAQDALRRSAAQLQGLADAAVAIHAARDVAAMLQVITEQARELIGAHQAVTSMTAGRDWAQAVNAVSLSDKYAAWRGYDAMPDGSGIYRLVAETNRPMRLTQEELEAHPAWKRFGGEGTAHPPMRGWLAVPLVGRDGRNLGIVQLSDKTEGEFTEGDTAILVQLAHMAAVAVENARLFSDAQRANRAKAEFLAAMSHELRTPLNAVGGYVDLLDLGIHGPLTAAQKEALSRITANQRHLLSLINDILSFARIEAGRMEFDLRALAASDVLASMEPLVAPQAAARGVGYTVRACDPGLRLRGDAERIRQILLNLVGNAAKFTPEGGWIVLAADGLEGEVCLRVRDSGPGIAPEQQERIFDPFQQVGRSLNRPGEGVGLGLAISRDLARAMGGDLTVRSAPGEGSTFTLRLPRVRGEE